MSGREWELKKTPEIVLKQNGLKRHIFFFGGGRILTTKRAEISFKAELHTPDLLWVVIVLSFFPLLSIDCLFICLIVIIVIYLLIYLFINLFIIYLLIYSFMHLFLFIYLFINQFIYLVFKFIHLFVYSFIYYFIN